MDPLLAAGLTTLGVIVAAWLTARVSRQKQRSDSGQMMIDQHQEDIKELRADGAAMRLQMATLQRQVRVQGDYIGQLRRHIADGHPPPPPPYPEGLIT
jgi:ribosomal protein L29